MRKVIHSIQAPAAIGTYSQAIQVDRLIFVSGQIPLVPATMEMVQGDFSQQVIQVFKNLQAILQAAGAEFSQVVKLNISLLDLKNFPMVNEVMQQYFAEPFPARAVVAVAGLPKGALVEVEAIAVLD